MKDMTSTDNWQRCSKETRNKNETRTRVSLQVDHSKQECMAKIGREKSR